MILANLRKNGYRITNQRQLLIGIILENECSSCKEIYYKAIKEDPTVGIATVYRIIKTLEDLGVINRKNLYNISYEKLNLPDNPKVVLVKEEDDSVIEIKKGAWYDQLETELRLAGYLENSNLTVILKTSASVDKEGENNDQLLYRCHCDNTSCGYNRKRDNAS